ncbi:MAG: hypothetical protein M3Z26_15800 [Bacteroidota bacterium]|nr:hypothetical protein [Bacteroidota bacterium]
MNESKIISLIEKFESLQLSKNIDFDKFNQYAITHHSTTIEGSTLTETETRLLLDEELTPKGKPLKNQFLLSLNHPRKFTNKIPIAIPQARRLTMCIALMHWLPAKLEKLIAEIIIARKEIIIPRVYLLLMLSF